MSLALLALLIAWLIMLVKVCLCDVKQRVIPNNLVRLIALLSLSLAILAIKKELYPIGWWLIIQPLSILLVGFSLFALGICGAGDVKLMTALSSVIYPSYWWPTLLLIAVIGGFLALGYLFYSWLKSKEESIHKNGLPYGVAIAIGAISSVMVSPIVSSLVLPIAINSN